LSNESWRDEFLVECVKKGGTLNFLIGYLDLIFPVARDLSYPLEALYVAVLLQSRKNNVEHPRSKEIGGRDLLGDWRSTQLSSTHSRTATNDEDQNGNAGKNTEDG